MKRFIIISITLFAIIFAAHSQLLWQISGNSVNSKSYLLATDLLTDATFLDSIPNLFKIYSHCNRVVTEMVYSDTIMQKAILQNAVLPDTVSLRTLYNTKEYEQLQEAVMLYLKIPLKQIEKLKPVYINELIRQQLFQDYTDYQPNHSSDNFFQSIAKQTGKPIVGLDNAGEAVYMLFEREPLQWQVAELLRTISHPEKEIKQQQEITRFYQQGQLNEISYQVAMPDNQTSISYSDYKMYCSRNREWVKKLTPLLKEGGQFIVLNSVFLGGEEGLIAQLRKSGYKVKPVNKK